jgi:hypothetical protein
VEFGRYDVVNGVRQANPKKMIDFISHWKNVGNMPAIGVVTAVGKIKQDEEITEEQFMMYGHVDRTAAKSAIGPQSSIDSGTLRDDISFLTDDPGAPRWMWGWIVYRDTFPRTKTHVTEWCWKVIEITWKLDDNGRRTGKPDITATTCAHHNCIDEFCEDYASIAALSPAN